MEERIKELEKQVDSLWVNLFTVLIGLIIMILIVVFELEKTMRLMVF